MIIPKVEEMRRCCKRTHWQGKESKCEGKKELKVEQKKGGKGESSKWGGIEESLQNERTRQLRETLPITPVLTSPARFHNHPFLVKILLFSNYPDRVRQQTRTGAAVVLMTASSSSNPSSGVQMMGALSSQETFPARLPLNASYNAWHSRRVL